MILSKLISQFLLESSTANISLVFHSKSNGKNFSQIALSSQSTAIARILHKFADIGIADIVDDTRIKNSKTIIVLTKLTEKYLSTAGSMKNITPTKIESFLSPTRIILADRQFFLNALANTRQDRRKEEVLTRADRVAEGCPVLWILSDTLLTNMGMFSSLLFGKPSTQLKIYGITGTNGKTTLASFFYYSWKKMGLPAAMIGTLGCRWSCSKQLIEKTKSTGYTTPRPTQLQRLLAQLLTEGVQKVALEVSSEALQLGRVEGCQFTVAIFTNLSAEHLDAHKTMENYYATKKRLFLQTRQTNGLLVVDELNKWGQKILKEFSDYPNLRVLSKKKNERLDKEIIDALADDWQQSLFFHSTNRRHYALMLLTDADLQRHFCHHKKEMLHAIPLIPGRFEIILPNKSPAKMVIADNQNKKRIIASSSDSPLIVAIVDYAHTPAALDNTLSQAKTFSQYLICVFGCGGNRDPSKRAVMGEIGNKYSDLLIICDDNPRFEDPAAIRQTIIEGIKTNQKRTEILEIGKRKEAIFTAVKRAVKYQTSLIKREESKSNQKIIILVAGKGHETEQIIQGRRLAFSDRTVLQEAFRKLI